jgi:hypothetical protein
MCPHGVAGIVFARPGGLFLLILRARNRKPDQDWLPNPLSRNADEVDKTMVELANSGFEKPKLEGKVGTSHVVTAMRQ